MQLTIKHEMRMCPSEALARDAVTDYSTTNFARKLTEALRPVVAILSLLSVPVVLIALSLVPSFVWPMLVPRHAATFYFNELRTTITLKYYMVWDEADSSGRYLTLETYTVGSLKIFADSIGLIGSA